MATTNTQDLLGSPCLSVPNWIKPALSSSAHPFEGNLLFSAIFFLFLNTPIRMFDPSAVPLVHPLVVIDPANSRVGVTDNAFIDLTSDVVIHLSP